MGAVLIGGGAGSEIALDTAGMAAESTGARLAGRSGGAVLGILAVFGWVV